MFLLSINMYSKEGKCAHEVLDVLPTTMCTTPEEVSKVYKDKKKGLKLPGMIVLW